MWRRAWLQGPPGRRPCLGDRLDAAPRARQRRPPVSPVPGDDKGRFGDGLRQGGEPLTPSKLERVLDALTEQDAVRYAVVTSPGGNVHAEAGDLPDREGPGSPEPAVAGGSGAVETPVRTLVEVGEDRVLHLGTTAEFHEEELRQLRSVVASAL